MSEGKYQLEQMQIEDLNKQAFIQAAFANNQWIKPNGTTVRIKDMSTTYIKNCLEMIKAGRAPTRIQWTPLLQAELVARHDGILAMDDELIHEQNAEIAKLKSKINRLEQKLASKKTVIAVMNDVNTKQRG